MQITDGAVGFDGPLLHGIKLEQSAAGCKEPGTNALAKILFRAQKETGIIAATNFIIFLFFLQTLVNPAVN